MTRATCLSLLPFLLASTAATAAPTWSQWGGLQGIEAGWVLNSMSVTHSAPLVNPSGCTVTNAGYATNPSDAGVNLFHTLLLSALLNRVEVRVLVDGCAFDKPRIIAVALK